MGSSSCTSNQGYDKGHYLRGMIWSSGGNLVLLTCGVLTVVFASRILSKSELGTYYLFLMVGSFSVVFSGFGLRTGSIKFLCSAPDSEKQDTVGALLTIRCCLILAVCGVLTIVIPLLNRLWAGQKFGSVAWYVMPFVVMTILHNTGMGILVGYNRLALFSVLGGLGGIIRMSFLLIFLLMGFGLKGLVFGLLISAGVSNIIVWLMVPCKLALKADREKISEIMKFGGWMYGSSLLSVARLRAAEFILASTMGAAAVAVYGNAMRIPNLLLRLFEAIRPVVLSYVSSRSSNGGDTSIMAIRILSGFVAVGSAFIIAFSRLIVTALFSERYLVSAPVFQMLSVWVLLSIVNYYLVLNLIGTDKVRNVFFMSIGQFLLIVGCHSLLIPRCGALGAAISLSIVAMASVLASIVMLAGKSKEKILAMVVAVCRSAVPLFILFVVVQLHAASFLRNAIFLVVFLLSLLFLRAITLTDIKILWTSTFRKKPIQA